MSSETNPGVQVSSAGLGPRGGSSSDESALLRVLHVITQLGQGGHEGQLYDCIRATKSRCLHRVVSLSPGGIHRDHLVELGIVVRDLERRVRGDPQRLYRLVREIRVFKPDIVHSHLFSGNLYGYLALRLAYPRGKRPALLTVRVTTNPERPRLMDRLEGMAFRGSQLVMVNAEALIPEVCAYYGLSRDRIRFLPNVLDPEKFVVDDSREEIRRDLNVPNHQLVVGHIGSFSPEKRHDLVLEGFAAARAEDTRFVLVLIGDGPGRVASERLARSLGLGDEVRWLGWREDVPRLIKAMDITVNTSDREGSSNAILESLAMGVPVVATRVGGTPEILDGGNAGVLIAPDDSDALAGALLRLAEDTERRSYIAEAGRRHVWRRHGPEQVYPRLLSIYGEADALRKRGAS